MNKTKIEMIGTDIYGNKACCVFEVELNWSFLDADKPLCLTKSFFPHELNEIVYFANNGAIARMIFPPYIDLSKAPELK